MLVLSLKEGFLSATGALVSASLEVVPLKVDVLILSDLLLYTCLHICERRAPLQELCLSLSLTPASWRQYTKANARLFSFLYSSSLRLPLHPSYPSRKKQHTLRIGAHVVLDVGMLLALLATPLKQLPRTAVNVLLLRRTACVHKSLAK